MSWLSRELEYSIAIVSNSFLTLSLVKDQILIIPPSSCRILNTSMYSMLEEKKFITRPCCCLSVYLFVHLFSFYQCAIKDDHRHQKQQILRKVETSSLMSQVYYVIMPSNECFVSLIIKGMHFFFLPMNGYFVSWLLQKIPSSWIGSVTVQIKSRWHFDFEMLIILASHEMRAQTTGRVNCGWAYSKSIELFCK